MRSSGGREQREHRGEGGLLGTWLGVGLGGWVWELPPSSPARVVDPHGVVQQSHGEFAGVWMPGEGTDAAAGPAGGRGTGSNPDPHLPSPSSNSQSHHQNKSQLSLLSKVASSANFPPPGCFSQAAQQTVTAHCFTKPWFSLMLFLPRAPHSTRVPSSPRRWGMNPLSIPVLGRLSTEQRGDAVLSLRSMAPFCRCGYTRGWGDTHTHILHGLWPHSTQHSPVDRLGEGSNHILTGQLQGKGQTGGMSALRGQKAPSPLSFIPSASLCCPSALPAPFLLPSQKGTRSVLGPTERCGRREPCREESHRHAVRTQLSAVFAHCSPAESTETSALLPAGGDPRQWGSTER